MARIKLTIPKKESVFTIELPVRITDVNYGGHLGNQVILEYCHEARVQYFNSINQAEKEFLNLGIIMSDSAIVYKAEAFWKDQITIEVFVDELNPYGFELFYLLSCQTKEIARVKTGLVFFDYSLRKIAKAPSELSSVLLLS